ncbi:MAG TPA: hypothetical protein VFZ09_46170 [Archangium sp.]|uniref:hypothetical protein n=1 Tax=Archangium sp. TaxID=1872627 RepID=UPI002E2FA5F4|nr:hypothetical protein [Archangium sp.]HEX5753664.1 hypothetical protein [Archangium sp.]
MSYLNPLRLHFAGKFQSNVSTVNNDPGHFDNASFKPSYQDMQTRTAMNGWFNPQGDAVWRLLGCRVTSAWMPSSGAVTSDPVLQCLIADSDTQAPAKLVDLDPEQQLVSEIWGLQVRIADSNGNTLLRGDFTPAAFLDIWDRAIGNLSGGDIDAGATYQSVLTNLQWADVSASPFLTALQAAASDGLLSIKFNVDNINLDFTSPDFMCGRIVGTIGPASASEPQHMVLGRQFMAAPSSTQFNFFFPAGNINFFPAVVDSSASCILLDLGNALSTDATTGQPKDIGDLSLTVPGMSTPLGTIASTGTGGYSSDPTWYSRTAGVVSFPLSSAQLQAIAAAPLTLASSSSSISEAPAGTFVRADRFVYRMSPGDSAQVQVYATQWGNPLANTSVTFTTDLSGLQPSNSIHPKDVPPVGTPSSALTFSPTATTNCNGLATLTFNASDPGTPRYFNGGQDYGIDGQVYGVRPSFTDSSDNGGPGNPWNFISFLVWSGFTASNPVTWTDVEPIFVQYGNLYPVMNRFLQLGDYASVVKHASLLTLAFGLDPSNPNAMPVTRDLSPAKRQAILSFLANPQQGVQKEKGLRAVARAAVAAAQAEDPPGKVKLARMGGKAAAAVRRVVVQSAVKGGATS